MTTIPVSYWPRYLLRDIPPDLRSALEEQATAENRSIQELTRLILCQHYGVPVPEVREPVRTRPYNPGQTTMIVYVPPVLFRRWKRRNGTIRQRILEAFTAHYQEEQ